MDPATKAIGIFDSGIGGLTVYQEVRKLLPHEDIVYLGDTARVPYGTKSGPIVLKYTLENSLFLLDCGVKAIVIACNTAAAYGQSKIQSHFKVPVMGVIQPGAVAALKKSQSKKIGIIGTEGTIRSEAYAQALRALDAKVQTISQACPLLVPLAEEGRFDGPVVELILQEYLLPFMQDPEIDALILGCTHYPLFKNAIQKILGSRLQLIDSAFETAIVLQQKLREQKLVNNQPAKGQTQFYSTDFPDRMAQVGKLFLGYELTNLKKVEIGV